MGNKKTNIGKVTATNKQDENTINLICGENEVTVNYDISFDYEQYYGKEVLLIENELGNTEVHIK